MYTPSTNHEHSDNDYDAGNQEDNSTIPPRQSAVPYTFVAKQRKSFYTDEHPEVPKIRRASRKQTQVGTLPIADIAAQHEHEGSKT
ncbi:MAG: hypothetical protein ACRDHZ_23995, partial [Ktedonobacteraceae bacterium]